jgi:phosphate butyryltransferase
VADEAKIDPKIFEILHEPDKAKALSLAIAKVRAGEADFLMKGLLDSSLYIRGIIDRKRACSRRASSCPT